MHHPIYSTYEQKNRAMATSNKSLERRADWVSGAMCLIVWACCLWLTAEQLGGKVA
jgi:hypothetical protein